LLRWVSLRHLLHERARTLLTVAGVALGVAVFVAVRLASHSALASFADTVDAVAGRADLQVAGGSEGFDERVFLAARGTPGVVAAAPVVQQHALARALPRGAPRPPRPDVTVMVLGLDVLRERPFGRASVAPDTGGGAGREALLGFLADPRAAAVTRAFARRHGVAAGDTVEVVTAGVPVPLAIRWLIDAEGLQQAFGGDVVVVDIGTAQEVFRRAGRLDRIDLVVDSGRRDAVRAALARVVPADVEVATPAGRTRQVEGMVSAFALNLTALSFVALFVATFLIHNAVSMAVVRRRREIGVLRTLGQTRAEVRAQFVLEGVALGAAGGVLGVALGTLLAKGALGAVSRTLTDLYLVAHADRLRLDPATYALGLALGVGSALVSALAPAFEAARTPPATTLREGAMTGAGRPPVGRWAVAGGVLLVAAAAVSWWTVAEHRRAGGFVAALLVVAGFSLAAPAATLAAETAAAPLVRRLLGVPGALGARALRESVARTSAVVAAILVSVAMMVALDIMVGSFRRTVDTWVRQTIRGDLYVEPVGHRAGGSTTVLPPELLEQVRALPGVAAVDTYRGARILHRGAIAHAVGVDFRVQLERGRLRLTRGDARTALGRALREDGALVTESFAHHHRLRAGDTLALATPSGVARLPVCGVLVDYSTDAGAVYVDRALYARLWRDPRTESFALYLAPGADAGAVERAVVAAAGPGRLLGVTPNRALRERVLEVFDQTFRITYALRSIAVLVALLGVAATLTALVLQRGREIGILRATGALRSQVRTMVLTESGLLGLIGGALGSVAGLALAVLLVHVINRQYFGWTIDLTVEPAVFVRALALLLAASLLAGLAPARLAAGRLPAEALRTE
jgi:putative ABC transport system permease protein